MRGGYLVTLGSLVFHRQLGQTEKYAIAFQMLVDVLVSNLDLLSNIHCETIDARLLQTGWSLEIRA
ncbi:hypothetical protein PMI30_03360 [Pseudomonas sp. GM50]|nr:hypothetical protein PMI30_03360 [Pseudomonas sp. GM50]